MFADSERERYKSARAYARSALTLFIFIDKKHIAPQAYRTRTKGSVYRKSQRDLYRFWAGKAAQNNGLLYQKARPPLGDEAVLRGAAAGEATTAYGAYYIVGHAPRARAVSLMRCLPLLQPQSPFLQVHGELLRSQGTRKRIYRCRA